ncbi:VOC family protein [Sphingobium sufflavum]|uniref:VOC family protein n=1 Tax=Sphingobium sufflavum TaxID=1129547 RepID=UPI001F22CA38|nr:VOC family protein [Sphingobium sufflavum]MCE7795158.1 VOC family protein [Sphingobium sufflavum]
MVGLLVNIDVPDVAAGVAFYTAALPLHVGRRFDDDFVELLGLPVPLYLLKGDAGSAIGPAGGGARDYRRHWTPVHLDMVVDDLDAAVLRAEAAGAIRERGIDTAPYGRIATFADPFGHGFCLLQFTERGYDALL